MASQNVNQKNAKYCDKVLEIRDDLHAVYIEWCYFKVDAVNCFKDGRETTEDDKYTGRQKR